MDDGLGTLVGFDKAAALEALNSLPLPPNPTGTRSYPTHTPLGKVMRHRGLSIQDVVRLPLPGIPNARIMSDYLAGRRPVPDRVAQAIARGIGCDWRLLAS